MATKVRFIHLALICIAMLSISCRSKNPSGHIRIDGSSTVYPITEAVAEEFQKGVRARVTIGSGGTGSGFAKLCRGEISVADASRPIKTKEEVLCKKGNIDFIEIPIAYDGIVIAVHPKADWINDLKTEDLKRLFEPSAQGKIMKWNQINPSWPDAEIHLFSPGVDSGTFDYFTSAIVGKEKASRGDITSSEDDNVLVQGVATDRYALGYFGFAYYYENRHKLKALAINGVLPSQENILIGKYRPLSRPLFIYMASTPSKGPVIDFVNFFLENAPSLVKEVGFIPLENSVMSLVKRRFLKRKIGSIFQKPGVGDNSTVEAILKNDD